MKKLAICTFTSILLVVVFGLGTAIYGIYTASQVNISENALSTTIGWTTLEIRGAVVIAIVVIVLIVVIALASIKKNKEGKEKAKKAFESERIIGEREEE